jgi:hypothetical protein
VVLAADSNSPPFSVPSTSVPVPLPRGVHTPHNRFIEDIEMEGETGPALTLPDFMDELAGRYHCRVSNSCGAVPSRAIVVTCAAAPTPGTGSLAPAATAAAAPTSAPAPGEPVTITRVSDDVCVPFGATLRLEVTATGSPAPTYQWHMDTPAYGRMAMQGETDRALEVADVFDDLAGQYCCHVTNAFGTVVSRAIRVTVLPAAS